MSQEILKRCLIEGMVVKLPPDQLERKLYLDVKNKLELIGGKWKGGKTQGFVFEEDPTEMLEQIASGENRNLKKEYQFFATPDGLADLMVKEALSALPIQEEPYRILEPSAGQGSIVKAINRATGGCDVFCYELMPLNQSFLKKISTVIFLGADFLEHSTPREFDAIIANPPFTNNQDIDHILKMYEVCKPGGVIVSLSSPSWKVQSNKKQIAFRKWLDVLQAEETEIEEGTFKESGTGIKTVLLTIIKPLVDPDDLPLTLSQIKEKKQPTKVQEQTAVDLPNPLAKLIEPTEKTIRPEDLPEPEVILQEIRKLNGEINDGLDEIDALLHTNTTDMKFFAQLFELIDGVDLTIKAERRAGKITLRVLPKTTDNIQPAVVTGTPEELDAGFFQAISLPIKQNKGLIIELDEMHKSLQSAKRVTEAKVKIADTPAVEEKKEEPKKKVDKKVAVKKSEPVDDMFA